MLIVNTKLIAGAKKRGAIGYFKISPSTFLALTTNKKLADIEEEALEISDYNFLIESGLGKIDCIPYLRIMADGKVVGHEGRHRCVAVQKAGGKYVVCAIIVVDKKPKKKKDLTANLSGIFKLKNFLWFGNVSLQEKNRIMNLSTFHPL